MIQHFYFYILVSFLITFYLLPIWGSFTDSRIITKFLSVILFIIGIYTLWKIKKNENEIEIQKPISNQNFQKEFIFIICLLLSFSYSYLYKLFEHLNAFFLVDYDFIAIAEILNNSLTGNLFRTHHYGQEVYGNYLSHHFSPSIIILSPFLFLSKTRLGYAYGLLFFINLSFILFAILLIKKNIRGNLFYFTVCLFAFNLYVHRLFLSYHFELLTVCFFLLFFIGLEFNKYYLSFLGILLLVLLKEDISLYITCLGVYFLIQKDWKYGIPILFFSLTYFLFVPSFFQSIFDKSTHVNWLNDWSKWGVTYRDIVLNLLSNPVEVLKVFFSKWKILRDFFFSFSPLILFSPSLLLVTLPIFTIHFLSDRPWYNSLYNYYSYSLISFFVINIILSVKKLDRIKQGKYNLSILIFCLSFSLYSNSGDKLFPYTKNEINMERVNAIENIVLDIVPQKSIATQFDLGGYISRDNPIYPLHEKNIDKDYLLIDSKQGITPYVDKERIQNMINKVLENQSHQLIIEKNGLQLYKKIK